MEAKQPHVVIFPFMAQGHTIPLLDLSKVLSCKGLKVTIITTPSNSPFILQSTSNHPKIRAVELEFPIIEGLPKGCENTDQLPSMDFYVAFLRATKQLRRPFERLLHEMSTGRDLPICVISDFFLGWTLAACREFNVPRLVFHGMGVFSMSACKSVLLHGPHKHVSRDDESFSVPGLPVTTLLTLADLPQFISNFDPTTDPLAQFMMETVDSELDSWGVVVNSFLEMEIDYVPALESFYRNGAKAWCVGPILLYNEMEDAKQTRDDVAPNRYPTGKCIEWLDKRSISPCSVIYVSFGTQTHISNAQLDEVALGLEMSGQPFIWVVRSITWSPPDGMEERIKERGLIIREWAPQRRILAHPAIGGFLSHCGWNSVLESISGGVPILAWPMIAEQRLNAKFVVDELQAGVKIVGCASAEEGTVIEKGVICKGVEELMGKDGGRRFRESAKELSRVARRAVHEGGSSDKRLDEMINRLINQAK
ncbi:scopoletin glucosyltransferase-like [Magnolia sinica]|uniref:scopoletin glucosyltransferase-like n=1 Tax=Magnolia sinica TaxID=86752 RepID=UPI002659DCA6|nr:scopoletin glucosyltransferase-like [Magnolia sinica]